jgi:trimethylamine--corrinoid protein Co-methyltransferase
VRPGTPCVFGTFVSEIDLHLGTPIFGTAGSALAIMAAGQLARRYGLPFRAGGALTARAEPDVRAAQESLMSLWPTMLAGPNLVVHGAGWVEGSLEASLEKLAQDVWPLEVLERVLTAPLPTEEEDFALEAFREVGPGGTFLGAAHTLRHVREAAAAAPSQAPVGWEQLLERYEEPVLDPAVEDALAGYVRRRKRALERAA